MRGSSSGTREEGTLSEMSTLEWGVAKVMSLVDDFVAQIDGYETSLSNLHNSSREMSAIKGKVKHLSRVKLARMQSYLNKESVSSLLARVPNTINF